MIKYSKIVDNGGSPVLVYQLEIDDGVGGPFTLAYEGLKLSLLYNKDVQRGR